MQLKQVFLPLCVTFTMIFASPTFAQELNKEPKPKNECDTKEFDVAKFYNGGKLFEKTSNQVDQIIKSERAAGRDPKVFLVSRAGQDLSGVVTLKDEFNHRLISLEDIFNDIEPDYLSVADTHVGLTQEKIKKRYKDSARQLMYSHVGFLIIDHPANKAPMSLPDGVTIEGLPGDYWVEELLKPCKTLTPKAWVTGLPLFFQDDPHDFRSLILVPEQRIQDQLMELLFKDEIQKPFLASVYNVAAPYNDIFEENSATWVLDILAAAQFPNVRATKSRQMGHRLLRENGFMPTKIIADSLKMRMATTELAPKSVNIRDENHKFARPFGVLELVTELSVREYLVRNRLIQANGIYELTLAEKDRYQEQAKGDEEGSRRRRK